MIHCRFHLADDKFVGGIQVLRRNHNEFKNDERIQRELDLFGI